ncbi:uncharacterized protein LACBIDRAFT_294395 [Laccaria bicolor S238N-H82]|uniref:Predicted protein n=1 Tax=Laccaria bicolor (strain S238N-H82 / ATCC MYA-4686) TaxID=486041 RepID=B0DAS0_LACBS|nr:uncharacterized protein LACBIDRAFT_294395 [Laccaria bicolor S238N-H82]EDR08261.1 predicted protein [Laccaria bicolor S238N-H82]|eukprot:XP_001881331.1 predicted protein [Laccaria bicolor S238N-H82]
MAQQTQKVPTGIAALDKILQGGVSRGHILEISGPPGSPKELVAMKIVSSFVNAREEVLFVGLAKDCPNAAQLVYHTSVHTLPGLMLFAHRLLRMLDSYPKIVSTSQLSTKLLKADGSAGTFDTGTRGILLPQLVSSSFYQVRGPANLNHMLYAQKRPKSMRFKYYAGIVCQPGQCLDPCATEYSSHFETCTGQED